MCPDISFVESTGNYESAPIVTAYLIPFEFIRMKKSNLAIRVCRECDYGPEIMKR